MKLMIPCLAAFVVTAPALAQPPSGRIDWTKPVIGVDGPETLRRAFEKEQALPIEVYSADELVAAASPSVQEFIQSLSTPLPPPCETPVANSPAAKPPAPAPCPAPPR